MEHTEPGPMKVGLTSTDYADAIMVQDACNLSGVVHSWSRIMDRVWIEARAAGQGTDYVNHHPINVMFADKVASLTGVQGITAPSMDAYSRAYQTCKERAQ